MKSVLYCFGKASAFVATEESRILKRMKRLPLEVIELKESKLSGEQALKEESQQLLKKIPPNAKIIVLAEEGKLLSSVDFAQHMSKWEENTRDLVFVIGSAYGIHPSLKDIAHFKFSLSPMTMTHDFARIFLVEQVYRAQCILEGHPYHHV